MFLFYMGLCVCVFSLSPSSQFLYMTPMTAKCEEVIHCCFSPCKTDKTTSARAPNVSKQTIIYIHITQAALSFRWTTSCENEIFGLLKGEHPFPCHHKILMGVNLVPTTNGIHKHLLFPSECFPEVDCLLS